MANFNYSGYNFYFEKHGDGNKPFLLLNGIMMSTKSWSVFVEEFSENNTLILLDFLDQGQSDKATKPYTQAFQVEVVKALLDHLQIKSLPLLGISYGGEVALQFVIKYPEYVERLGLFNTAAYTSPLLKDIGDSWNFAAETGNGRAYYLASIPMIYSSEFYARKIEWMKRREELLVPVFSNKVIVDGFVRLTKSAESHDVRSELHKIEVETLVVGSAQDYLTPAAEQYFLAANIKNSNHIILESAGHASMYERPSIFATLVLGFVNKKTRKYII